MLLVPTVVEPASEPLPARSTPVVWMWLALVLAVFAVERLVAIDHDLGLGLFPPGLFAGVTFTIASWTLYGDPALFDLWQPWSHLLVHPRWWLLAVEVVLMLAIGRALERVLAPTLFIAVLGCLAPLGGVLLVLLAGQPFHAGGLPLMAGLLGVAIGRLPKAQVRCDLVWWLVVAVGSRPLFRLPVHTLLILLLVFVLVTAAPHEASATALVTALVSGIGIGLGALIRHRATLPTQKPA